MKNVALLLLAASLLLLPAAHPASAQSASAPSLDEQQVLDVEVRYNQAFAANNLPLYFSFLAPDFTQWLPVGRATREQYEASWTRFVQEGGKVVTAKFAQMKIQISPHGDAAAASYLLHVVTQSKAGTNDGYFQESDFLFKRNGEWKLVHLNYAPVPGRNVGPPAKP